MTVQVAKDHRMLVIPRDERVLALVPAAREVNGAWLAVPHGQDETRVLRNLGVLAPAPIHHYYNWPGPPPFKAQRATAALLSVEPRAYVLNDMGTGKTRSVLYAFDFLRQSAGVKRLLVVAPLSTLTFTWKREIFSVFPHLEAQVLHGTRQQRLKRLAERADVYIVNHDGVETIEDALRDKGFDAIAFDELSVYRNPGSKRSKAARRLSAGVRFVWGLTGTPMPKDPTDAFGQIRLITPERVTRSATHFRNEVMVQVSQFRWAPKPDARERVFGYMQPAVRYRMEDCVDLPKLTYVEREVDIGPEARRHYEQMRKHARTEIDGGRVDAANEGVLRGKLLQLAAGIVYDRDGKAHVVGGGSRFDTLAEIIEQSERKVLVFCPWRALVDDVYDRLGKAGLAAEKLYGGVNSGERLRIFNRVQDPRDNLRALVAHPKTMSHGLNLTGAATVVWYAPLDDLEIYEQANARIPRPGQTWRHLLVVHLRGTPAEAVVARRLRQKEGMQGSLLEMFQ